jgi:glycosyltransferase involved in cell wall biosynthesis
MRAFSNTRTMARLSALPSATVVVYDNNSRDSTAQIAAAAGAILRREETQGKGHVVRRMFADVDAKVYIMVDGDGTYDAGSAPHLVRTLLAGPYDMVNVARDSISARSYRRGHRAGNYLLTTLVKLIFGANTTDMLSGYKAFSRRFVKTFPSLSKGFEIETELMIHALELRVPVAEIRAPYGERPTGSWSKLSTIRDGVKIVRLIGFFLKHERPLAVFTAAASVFVATSLALGLSVIVEFMRTGLVPRLPSAVAAASLFLCAVVAFSCGLILDTVTHSRREAKRIAYLQYLPPHLSVTGDKIGT